ncbi:hypothetical protein TWF696_000088 [Orbilia brochopaga]|uniref:Uncharacterized protein n=1 Tax=Orbilia brochopaga TaxID=3140254 RepID=A0AAV9VDW2_9PEZI
MSFLNKLRNGATEASSSAPVINVETNGRSKSRSPPTSSRFRSKSPNGRARSAVRSQSFPNNPPAFPTPFHQFKLHPLSNKNQVNALKFIDRIDSLLFLGHTGQTVLNAVQPCMANSEATAWYNRVMNSDIRRPSTIEEFRALLITDHIWSIEQNRINSRYQSTNANNANRRDPYLDSAEFKLHLAYIRDVVRLEEAQTRDEKKIAQLETDKIQLTERENTLQMAVADLQNDAVARNGGQPVPVLQRTNDILSNMKQLDDSKLKVSMLEQEKRALNEKLTSLQMKVDDMDSTNTQMSTVRLQLQNSNSKNAELQGIILQLEQSNSRLQQQLIAAQNSSPVRESPPPTGTAAEAKELQKLKKQNQQILDELHQKEIRIHDLEAQVRSYSFLQAQHNEHRGAEVQPLLGLQSPTAQQTSQDRAAIAGLEEIIKQKDVTIGNLHANLNKLTDEAISRIHRVYQVEQLLLDSQLVVRNKDAQIFTLERKIQNLGHSKDCNCASCSLGGPMRTTSPEVKRTTSPDLKPAPRVMSIGSSSELSGPTINSRTSTPFQQLPINGAGSIRSPPPAAPRFLDIKFKYNELYPSFLPPTVAPRVAQLLQNGLTILHPSHEFTKLWENIAHGLLETLSNDAQSLGDLTRHMKLCFRDRDPGFLGGESPNGLVVAPVWNEVWSSVSGLDVVCDF